jgi:hypothetical protein
MMNINDQRCQFGMWSLLNQCTLEDQWNSLWGESCAKWDIAKGPYQRQWLGKGPSEWITNDPEEKKEDERDCLTLPVGWVKMDLTSDIQICWMSNHISRTIPKGSIVRFSLYSSEVLFIHSVETILVFMEFWIWNTACTIIVIKVFPCRSIFLAIVIVWKLFEWVTDRKCLIDQ